MDKPREKCEDVAETGHSPYQDLYIYLLKGPVMPKDESLLGNSFLGNWVEEDSSFLFFSTPADPVIADLLKTKPALELVDSYHFTYEQWQGGSSKSIKVDDFVIVPAWEKGDAADGKMQIFLDPGVVFGNGLHPTTRDCLRALSYASRLKPFMHVLDLGTGTGVLALAAAFLGAKRVRAVDLNPLCVKTAMENVKLNDFDNVIQVIEGPAEDFVDEVADLIIANIQSAVIQGLLERRSFREKDRFIISGLMRSEAREIKYRIARKHFHVIREWDYEMTWYTLLIDRLGH